MAKITLESLEKMIEEIIERKLVGGAGKPKKEYAKTPKNKAGEGEPQEEKDEKGKPIAVYLPGHEYSFKMTAYKLHHIFEYPEFAEEFLEKHWKNK